MLSITIPACSGEERWDERTEEFVYSEPMKEQTLMLEHSLVSLSKWESKWHKPFLSREDKTYEETIDYIRCMTITPNVKPSVYNRLTSENIETINNYIKDSMTATWFSEDLGGPPNREIITAEVIYYYMIAFNIPFECQKWHLNRLMTLIRVCNINNQPSKKMKTNDILSRNAALNAERRKKFNTKG